MAGAPLVRVFYVVYPDEPGLCAWLNPLRALANPHEKSQPTSRCAVPIASAIACRDKPRACAVPACMCPVPTRS